VKDGQISRDLQVIPLDDRQTGRKVGPVKGRSDRHLLDHRSLRQALLPSPADRVIPIALKQHTAQDGYGH
jgi:hypothetical protein